MWGTACRISTKFGRVLRLKEWKDLIYRGAKHFTPVLDLTAKGVLMSLAASAVRLGVAAPDIAHRGSPSATVIPGLSQSGSPIAPLARALLTSTPRRRRFRIAARRRRRSGSRRLTPRPPRALGCPRRWTWRGRLSRTVGGVVYLNPGSAGPRRFNRPITLAMVDLKALPLRPEVCRLIA